MLVINNNIIEQVTDFKYLGYRMAEYKSDLEDKLQTYNKINLLKPNDIYICRTAALTSRRYILNIYSTNIYTKYFKHAA